MSFHRVVGIGTSIGGVDALTGLVSKLPGDFAAPILVVQHIGGHDSALHELLMRAGKLEAVRATEGMRIERGKIVVAAPDRHLLVREDRVQLSASAKENHTRPAVDPLFRSLALTYGPAAIGIVLSGNLDDGTAGIQAIKACGGVALAQDPKEAANPSMPLSAVKYGDVDHVLPVADMAPVLAKLVAKAPGRKGRTHPALLLHEHQASLAHGDAMEHLEKIASPSHFVCPECNGTLWRLHDTRPTRFRCHTGHAFTQRSLRDTQVDAVDQALWSALRSLQEEEQLLREVSASAAREGQHDAAKEAGADADQLAARMKQLRSLIEQMPTVERD